MSQVEQSLRCEKAYLRATKDKNKDGDRDTDTDIYEAISDR